VDRNLATRISSRGTLAPEVGWRVKYDALVEIPEVGQFWEWSRPDPTVLPQGATELSAAQPDSEYLDWCKDWLRECIRVLKAATIMTSARSRFIAGLVEW